MNLPRPSLSNLTAGHVWGQMDEEAAGVANGKARLMTAEELPAWVTSPPPATNGASAASDMVSPPFAECLADINSGIVLSTSGCRPF